MQILIELYHHTKIEEIVVEENWFISCRTFLATAFKDIQSSLHIISLISLHEPFSRVGFALRDEVVLTREKNRTWPNPASFSILNKL